MRRFQRPPGASRRLRQRRNGRACRIRRKHFRLLRQRQRKCTESRKQIGDKASARAGLQHCPLQRRFTVGRRLQERSRRKADFDAAERHRRLGKLHDRVPFVGRTTRNAVRPRELRQGR